MIKRTGTIKTADATGAVPRNTMKKEDAAEASEEILAKKKKKQQDELRINSFHHVVVVVLGDVGRSPRMQYHTMSLLEHGYQVTLVGYEGEELHPLLQHHKNATTEPLSHYYAGSTSTTTNPATTNDSKYPGHLNVLRFQPYTPSKCIRQNLKPVYYMIRFIELFRLLLYVMFLQVSRPVQCVLVQNPPSVPLLLITYLYCRWTEASFCIDWHNLGYTMFDVPDGHILRRIVKWYESIMSKRADGHFCVTRAMQEFLNNPLFSLSMVPSRTLLDDSNNSTDNKSDTVSEKKDSTDSSESTSICTPTVHVLYDRPPTFFHRTTQQERVDLMTRLENQISKNGNKEDSLLSCTFPTHELMKSKDDCSTFLIMSSTSWTTDEDFGILLDALIQLNKTIQTKRHAPKIAVVITGKGPEKTYYQHRIKELRPFLINMTIDTMWLESCDYPLLLGCANVGVSLHTSTSGLDLPIKIYDMFGCHVPVCAINFQCLHEVMKHDWNGYIFSSSDQLAEQLEELALDFSAAGSQTKEDCDSKEQRILPRMISNISTMNRWNEEWDTCAYPVIQRLCRHSDQLHWDGINRRRIFSFVALLGLFVIMIFLHSMKETE